MAHTLTIPDEATRSEVYRAVLPQIFSLIDDETDLIANLANISAALYAALGVLWVGFYLRKGSQLVLGPFQGPIACTRIDVEPVARGVCGACAERAETIIVPDVEKFPGHIACSTLARSEIVLPLVVDDRTELVLDIDSVRLDEFSNEDRNALESLLGRIKEKHFPSIA